MKTGFVNAFVNTPGSKSYKYHGTNDNCVIQPDPDPFLPVPTDPVVLAHWVKVLDIVPSGFFYMYWGGYPILPSSDPDICTSVFPDGMARYIKFDFKIVSQRGDGYVYYLYNNGFICSETVYDGFVWETEVHYRGHIWTPGGWLLAMYDCGPGSYLQVYISDTGEWPG